MNNRQFDPFASEPITGPHRQGVIDSPDMPEYFGRYRVTGKLGTGHFGQVYSAYDEELHRQVAIKVPRRKFSLAGNDDGYAVEARILARLDHPNIVPVYDIERMDDGRLLIVSKFIEGSNFAVKLKNGRLGHAEAARLVATVADALHYAHLQGLVHRDVKPANILIDVSEKPYVADFGLALREEDFGKGPTGAGTVPYMSPEQARSEGHRVDGRSDVFSLGVVFYETLTGRRPFVAESLIDLLDQITDSDPRPPRQIQDTIPKELERICLKAMSKPAGQRYTTAKDMADELRQFLDADKSPVGLVPAYVSATTVPVPTAPPPDSSHRDPVVVPKGLRSFDAADAEFFPELMPGPRDREGLPESIRFWRRRIECLDADDTFAVGLIYGPSGCGKSSMVKAGLMPRLSEHVIPIYVEAANELTEERLLSRLRKLCPELSTELTLSESIGVIRRGMIVERGKKVLILIDQFEQWLHSRKNDADDELIRALRQCDGGRVQCILLVRDDFWMAISRLMHDLEIRIAEDENAADVDLFDERHAKKVLTVLGRAHGALPAGAAALSAEQQKFIDQAVAGLNQGGKLIPVRLALFSEMVKSREWTPATLKAIGGIEGVGVTFLEEAFSATTAPAQNRMHERAARAVLKMLLPEIGKDIKGNMRSRDELLAASGYVDRPKDFEELMRILHRELRLVSPSDPQGTELGSGSNMRLPEAGRYYQLTHDYLVPALREWLTRKQRETRKGRAEMLLTEQAEIWNVRPANRQLPSFWQWANIRLATDKQSWTVRQKKMMRKAGRQHIIRIAVIACGLLLIGLMGWAGLDELRADQLVRALLDNDTPSAPKTIEEMDHCRILATSKLRAELAKEKDPDRVLRARLGLLPVDASQVESIYQRLLDCDDKDFIAIRTVLWNQRKRIDNELWTVLENEQYDVRKRLRAAGALAEYDSTNVRWDNTASFVARSLVGQSTAVIRIWIEALRPAGKYYLEPLADILSDETYSDEERSTATDLLLDFSTGQTKASSILEKRIVVDPSTTLSKESAVANAKKRANVAIGLFQIKHYLQAQEVLKHSSDSTVRTFFIHGLSPKRVPIRTLLELLQQPNLDPGVHQGLILGLGEYIPNRFSESELKDCITTLKIAFESTCDPGVHSAAEWLLRQHGHADWLNTTIRKYQNLDKNLLASGERPANGRRWLVNSLGQTMVIVPAPDRKFSQINQPGGQITFQPALAVASTEVSLDEFRALLPNQEVEGEKGKRGDMPAGYMTWYKAAAHCNRLSAKENIPESEWCYEPNKSGEYGPGMKIRQRAASLSGYRLLASAEWEHVCRAGTSTKYYFGESGQFASKYAWFHQNSENSCHPVGELRPNPFGIFDLHGNLNEWCHVVATRRGGKADAESKDSVVVADFEIQDNINMPLRGGHFDDELANIRSSDVNMIPVTGILRVENINLTMSCGFRVARNIK